MCIMIMIFASWINLLKRLVSLSTLPDFDFQPGADSDRYQSVLLAAQQHFCFCMYLQIQSAMRREAQDRLAAVCIHDSASFVVFVIRSLEAKGMSRMYWRVAERRSTVAHRYLVAAPMAPSGSTVCGYLPQCQRYLRTAITVSTKQRFSKQNLWPVSINLDGKSLMGSKKYHFSAGTRKIRAKLFENFYRDIAHLLRFNSMSKAVSRCFSNWSFPGLLTPLMQCLSLSFTLAIDCCIPIYAITGLHNVRP